jgi:predicted NACHT family NTPase
MGLETFAPITAKWFWDNYGKLLIDGAVDKLKGKWREFNWKEAEEKYCCRLKDHYSTVRVLGNPKPLNLDEIFTDVYVLDKPTAFRRFDIRELQDRPAALDTFQVVEENRKPALRLVPKKKRLFILGKPGSGKTTFLKYLAIQATEGKFQKTPIFISLREWSDSKLELLPFIVQQFEICAFPDAESFILRLLKKGNALILFDGLDEVNIEGNQRSQMINNLTNFAKRYPDIHICLTCRIAATDYSFDQFTYIEIADFDKKQQDSFVNKWYHEDKKKLARFQAEFDKPENSGLRDLARTPLLLALLCLAFDETLSFPNRRVDLYKESIDALLKKWDSSRGIKRDEVYRKLSPARKEQMLARIAAQNFESGTYFVSQSKLESQILNYLQQLPDIDDMDPPDGEVVLKATEAQHGILVERAHSIYSFSHLTFQEYLTARYIVDNAANGTVDRLIRQHLSDNRWREVFLITVSLLDNADAFCEEFLKAISNIIHGQEPCESLLKWSREKSEAIGQTTIEARTTMLMLALMLNFSDDIKIYSSKIECWIIGRNRDFGFGYKAELSEDVYKIIIRDGLGMLKYFVKGLACPETRSRQTLPSFVDKKSVSLTTPMAFAKMLKVELTDNDMNVIRLFTDEQRKAFAEYVSLCEFFSRCLSLAAVTNRKNIESKLLSLPTNN